MSCPRHPDQPLGNPITLSWGPTAGREGRSCTKFVGIGAEGANKKGYCTHWEPTQATPVAQPESQGAGVGASPSEGNLRLQAAIAALDAAAHSVGSPADILNRAAVYYHYFLKPAFTGDAPLAANGTAPLTKAEGF